MKTLLCSIRFSEREDFLVQASLLGDPSKAFYIFFPLCFALDQAVGVRYLASVILSEWSNQILKWLLHGHRPYWWIPLNLPHLASNYAQTSITCETGPGNPSGHVMISVVTCGALYRLMQTFFCSSPKTSNNPLALAVNRMAGNILIAWVAMIGASRIYILAHFPHQCFFALLIGFFCYQLAFSSTVKWTKWSAKVLIISAVFLATSAFGVFMTAEHFLQFDINWSLQLASKFCEKVRNSERYKLLFMSQVCLNVNISKAIYFLLRQKSIHGHNAGIFRFDFPRGLFTRIRAFS